MRRRDKRSLGWLIVAALLLSACAPTLRVGTSGDYPPFSVIENEDSVHGFDMSVARGYARDRNLNLELVLFSWPELEDQLRKGAFDVAMSGVTVRGDRLAIAPMTSAVARAQAIVVVRSDHPDEPLDQPGVIIAVNRGGHLEKVTRARFSKAQIKTVLENRSLPDLLAARKVDAVVTDSAEHRSFHQVDSRVSEVLADDRKAYWVAPGRADLARDMNEWMRKRLLDDWIQNERGVWMDDRQISPLPIDDAIVVDHITQRLLLMPLVAEVKRSRDLAVEVPEREQQIYQAARKVAAQVGLDPERYAALVRVEVGTAKKIQRAVLAAEPTSTAADLPDLEGQIRPAIDRIDAAIRTALVQAAPVQSSVETLAEALRIDAPLPGFDEASRRAMARAIRAIPAAHGSR